MSTVLGSCVSRLNELRTYSNSNVFNEQYIGNGSFTNNGVDFNLSTPLNIIYYLGGIRYNDVIGDVIITTFSFYSSGYNSVDFFHSELIKLPEKENIISNSKIENDVFIDRQEKSVFNNNYKLEYINNLSELLNYAGGKSFNIINNT